MPFKLLEKWGENMVFAGSFSFRENSSSGSLLASVVLVDRGKKARAGSLPSEPYERISRIRLSSWRFYRLAERSAACSFVISW